ncbi:MAG: HAD-IC family P-type ATPase, partial [Gammaproteobacteria bacterium]
IIGFFQEARALRAIDALARTMSSEATVIRGGDKQRIPADELVPGDIVLLRSGDKVPADLRLLRARNLQIDESALTGESVPVEKRTELCPHDTPLSERVNMAWSSTLVTYGAAVGAVVAIGDDSEIGRIHRLIASADVLATPLTRKIARFGRMLLIAILALALLTIVVGVLRGETLFEMFMAAVALAVAAIPEGLPAAMTIMLAIGMARMARNRAIIRRLPAVETLGSTTVICSDKTGTLTRNEMTVVRVCAGRAQCAVTGTGYAPEGAFVGPAGKSCEAWRNAALMECLRCGLLCNDSRILRTDAGWRMEGDPTEGALITAARKAGLDPEDLQWRLPRLDTLPFESALQCMATLHEDVNEQRRFIYMKGSLESVLARCTQAMDARGGREGLDRTMIQTAAEGMAADGLRVLAFALAEADGGTRDIDQTDLSREFTFLGLQGMLDPPRPEVPAAIAACRAAGIEVKAITGDHAVTALAVSRAIGLVGAEDEGNGRSVVTGTDLSVLHDEQLIATAERMRVFARVAPEQKLRLVEALQARGHVVAMTGDGVNDAPALRRADIGVAMGAAGTDVAREAADMVLTDDNFATIRAAVEEGRAVYDNLIKFITWTLPTNLGEGLVILAAILAGTALPILPVQILWINMTTAVLLGLMLAFERHEPGIMQRPPRRPDSPILTAPLVYRILLVGILMLVGAFGLFEWELLRGAPAAEARTATVNVFVFTEIFYLFNCRSLRYSMFRLGVFSNRWLLGGVAAMIVLQLGFTYLPAMNAAFDSRPIGAGQWAVIIAFSLAVYLIVGAEKWLLRRLAARNGAD